MQPLTVKQRKLLNFIKSRAENGVAKVTQADMARYLGLSAPPSVANMLNVLILKGYLIRHSPFAPSEGATYSFPEGA